MGSQVSLSASPGSQQLMTVTPATCILTPCQECALSVYVNSPKSPVRWLHGISIIQKRQPRPSAGKKMPWQDFPRVGSVQKAPCRTLEAQGREAIIIAPDTIMVPSRARTRANEDPGILHMGLLP